MATPTATPTQAKKSAQPKQTAGAAPEASAQTPTPTAESQSEAKVSAPETAPTATLAQNGAGQAGEAPAGTAPAVEPDAVVTDKGEDKTEGENAGSSNARSVLVLTNCTDSPRGIAFKKGIVILQGREMRRVPDDEQDEVRDMFKNRTFQRFVDNGIFRLSEMSDDEQSVVVKTPEPPAGLDPTIRKDSMERPVGTSTGSKAKALNVVEHQTGGPLPEKGTGAEA